MCGIVGVFPLNKTDLQVDANLRRKLALFIHNEILFETVARGKDATGVSAAFGPPSVPNPDVAENFWCALKQPVDTEDFFLNDGTSSKYAGQDDQANLERFMDVSSMIQRPLRHIIGHTRAKTVGSEFNPLNNHPILVGKIIGVHNGGVKNYKTVYDKHKNMTPLGEVDSEVIMQLLAENANERELGVEDIEYVTKRIVGPRAVIAYNRDHPGKVIYFHDKERPLELAYIEELGLAVICSERKFFHKAMHVYHRASLSLKRNLPSLTIQWKDVPTDRGGVIDVLAPIEGDVKAGDLFELITTPDTLDEYDNSVKTTVNQPFKTNNYAGGGGKHNTGYTAPKKSKVHKDTPAADIVDVTKYGYKGDSANELPPEVKSIVASASVMDDTGDEDDNTDEGLNAIDAYSRDELVKAGIEYVMSTEGRRDDTLLINKHERNYSQWLSKPLCEEDAREIVQQLYPEAFGEGYEVGFKAGVDEQIGLQDDDDASEDTTELDNLRRDVFSLKNKLEEEADKQKKAAAYIANMKAFIMGAVIVQGLGHVDEEGVLVFQPALESFLETAKGFGKTNPDMVKDIFNARDLQTISSGLSKVARDVKRRTPALDAAGKLKNIKS